MDYSEHPWTAEQECLNSIDIRDGNGRTIATVMVDEEDEITEESRANAQLMILAPEMYELLKGLTTIEQTTGSPCPLCGGGFEHKENCIIPVAEKLIARVEAKG